MTAWGGKALGPAGISEKEPGQADSGEEQSSRIEDDLDGMQRGMLCDGGSLHALRGIEAVSQGRGASTRRLIASARLETNTSMAHMSSAA